MICAEGAAEISSGLLMQRKSYPGKSSYKLILPLLAKRGEGRGEESSQSYITAWVRRNQFQ
jgi:hypothetical protein